MIELSSETTGCFLVSPFCLHDVSFAMKTDAFSFKHFSLSLSAATAPTLIIAFHHLIALSISPLSFILA